MNYVSPFFLLVLPISSFVFIDPAITDFPCHGGTCTGQGACCGACQDPSGHPEPCCCGNTDTTVCCSGSQYPRGCCDTTTQTCCLLGGCCPKGLGCCGSKCCPSYATCCSTTSNTSACCDPNAQYSECVQWDNKEWGCCPKGYTPCHDPTKGYGCCSGDNFLQLPSPLQLSEDTTAGSLRFAKD